MFGFLKKQHRKEKEFNDIVESLYQAFDLITELREKDDDTPLEYSFTYEEVLPVLSGIEEKVTLVSTPNGIGIAREDGSLVEDRRSLTQKDFKEIPDVTNECYFVNLNVPSGDVYSCIIAQPDAQIFGSMRAFWWSLAKGSLSNLCQRLNYTKMTEKAYVHVCANARMMWDIVIEESGSIDNLRDQLVPIRNVHLEVMSQMKDSANSDADKLGIDIAQCLVLATQSEDTLLEKTAFIRLKQFFWLEGEEPQEFYPHLSA